MQSCRIFSHRTPALHEGFVVKAHKYTTTTSSEENSSQQTLLSEPDCTYAQRRAGKLRRLLKKDSEIGNEETRRGTRRQNKLEGSRRKKEGFQNHPGKQQSVYPPYVAVPNHVVPPRGVLAMQALLVSFRTLTV
jgi:hypothetical protein